MTLRAGTVMTTDDPTATRQLYSHDPSAPPATVFVPSVFGQPRATSPGADPSAGGVTTSAAAR
jgi:hypothetical protein